MKRKLSKRMITFCSASALAGYFVHCVDNGDSMPPEHVEELRRMHAGQLIPTMGALRWLALEGRKVYTAIALEINADPEEEKKKEHDMRLIKLYVDCIENVGSDHPCFERFMGIQTGLDPETIDKEALLAMEELDRILEAMDFPQEDKESEDV